MTSSDLRDFVRGHGRASSAAIMVLAAVVLTFVPLSWTAACRTMAHEALRPGQRTVAALADQLSMLVGRIGPMLESAERLAQAESELHALGEENQQLKRALLALEAARKDPEQPVAPALIATEPLMRASLIETRVLGHEARAYLENRGIVEAGKSDGVESGDLLIDPAVTLVDSGRDMGVDSGDYLLAGRRIWGKIIEVGPHTGSVRRIYAPGYRDLVQLAHQDDDGLKLGPRGILEGTGARLCRVRFVETSEPISVGDLVYAAGDQAALDEPLLYGTVVRVERSTEAAHWDVWMKPAAGRPLPNRLAVLRRAVNPRRLGDRAESVDIATPHNETARSAADLIQSR